jgi:hypothetical protein
VILVRLAMNKAIGDATGSTTKTVHQASRFFAPVRLMSSIVNGISVIVLDL